jgi:TPR repeat protein
MTEKYELTILYEAAFNAYSQGDYIKAIHCYKKIAEQLEDAEVQKILGWMCLVGEGTEKDINQSVSWYSLAAKRGNNEAMFSLGKVYIEKGQYQQAISFLKESGEKGYGPSLYKLGCIYGLGKGIQKDDAKSFSFFKKSYESGHLFGTKEYGLLLIKKGRIFSGLILYIGVFFKAIYVASKDEYDVRIKV